MGFEIKETSLNSTVSAGFGTATIKNCKGYIAAIEIKSVAGSVPTTAWDVSITNDNDVSIYENDSVFSGTAMVDCPALATYFKVPVEGTLNVYGANMGTSKIAQVIVYLDNY